MLGVTFDKFDYSFQSVSAFAPICNPVECPWGQKAFTGYLGSNKETWKVNHFSLLFATDVLRKITLIVKPR